MPDTAIAAQVHQPLDVHRSFAAEVALDRETRNGGPELRHFRLRQVLDRGLWCNARCLANLFRARIADSENRRQRDNDMLVQRNIYACYTCHCKYSFFVNPDAACDARQYKSPEQRRYDG
jgi:hypothetical protein